MNNLVCYEIALTTVHPVEKKANVHKLLKYYSPTVVT